MTEDEIMLQHPGGVGGQQPPGSAGAGGEDGAAGGGQHGDVRHGLGQEDGGDARQTHRQGHTMHFMHCNI